MIEPVLRICSSHHRRLLSRSTLAGLATGKNASLEERQFLLFGRSAKAEKGREGQQRSQASEKFQTHYSQSDPKLLVDLMQLRIGRVETMKVEIVMSRLALQLSDFLLQLFNFSCIFSVYFEIQVRLIRV